MDLTEMRDRLGALPDDDDAAVAAARQRLRKLAAEQVEVIEKAVSYIDTFVKVIEGEYVEGSQLLEVSSYVQYHSPERDKPSNEQALRVLTRNAETFRQ